MYAVLDIGSDLIFRRIPGSDAEEMAKLTFIPGIIWGILWMLTALFFAALFLRLALVKSPYDNEE